MIKWHKHSCQQHPRHRRPTIGYSPLIPANRPLFNRPLSTYYLYRSTSRKYWLWVFRLIEPLVPIRTHFTLLHLSNPIPSAFTKRTYTPSIFRDGSFTPVYHLTQSNNSVMADTGGMKKNKNFSKRRTYYPFFQNTSSPCPPPHAIELLNHGGHLGNEEEQHFQ